MTQIYETLFERISNLSYEKAGKVLSFVKFIEQETEAELFLDSEEEEELHLLLNEDYFISSEDLLSKIKGLPDD